MNPTISTGSNRLDELLNGGLTAEFMHLVYGEAETGKTTVAIQCAVNCARMGYKTIYIDSEGTFSARRLTQIAASDAKEIASNIILARPATFKEQSAILDNLDSYLTKKVGLIVVDTISSLYSVELGGESKSTFKLNRELNKQMAYLAQIVKTRKIAALATSQVRNVFTAHDVNLEPVARRVMKFWANVVISLKLTQQNGVVRAVLEKHPRRLQPASCFLRIVEEGIKDYEQLS
ncbi:MAG TPA: ATPase domain-containing protein [Candidatus Krumholzibacteriaceae bacterium]|nr:ATPase domain-containing protein [Candidatus Krumholzibacteriaceae bacterium]